jgi:hypothetical protein
MKSPKSGSYPGLGSILPGPCSLELEFRATPPPFRVQDRRRSRCLFWIVDCFTTHECEMEGSHSHSQSLEASGPWTQSHREDKEAR